MSTDPDLITGAAVSAAVRLHTELGPGLLESVYETLLGKELERRFKVERQRSLDFEWNGIRFKGGLRVDLLVDGVVVIDLRVGLLINFGEATLRSGLRRMVNGYSPSLGSSLQERSRRSPRLRVNRSPP